MLRKNLYSQKFKPKPIKPSYTLTNVTRTATIKIIKKYDYETYDSMNNYLGNSLEGATEDFLENYRMETLPEVDMAGEKTRVDTQWFLGEEALSSKTQFLDFIQIFIDYAKHKQQYIREINNLFELDNFGYRIINEEITKIGSQETFEMTKKAFDSIKKISLGNAKTELQEALKDYYFGNKPIAIKKALDSIDTILKFIIINDEKIIDKDISNGKGQTKNLIGRVVSAGYFLCPGAVPLQIGIEHILASMRNKIPGAGHSLGLRKIEVNDECAKKSLHTPVGANPLLSGRLAIASELNPAPDGVIHHREARGMGCWATTQVKGLSPEITFVSVADVFHVSGRQYSYNRNRQGYKNPTGSETVARYQKECVGTWETHNVPEKVWDTKPINGEVNQMTLWESDKSIVARKQGNACGAKGLTGKPMEGDTTSALSGGQRLTTEPKPMTYSSEGREVFLKSRVREIRKHGSVRGFTVSSERRWL